MEIVEYTITQENGVVTQESGEFNTGIIEEILGKYPLGTTCNWPKSPYKGGYYLKEMHNGHKMLAIRL